MSTHTPDYGDGTPHQCTSCRAKLWDIANDMAERLGQTGQHIGSVRIWEQPVVVTEHGIDIKVSVSRADLSFEHVQRDHGVARPTPTPDKEGR